MIQPKLVCLGLISILGGLFFGVLWGEGLDILPSYPEIFAGIIFGIILIYLAQGYARTVIIYLTLCIIAFFYSAWFVQNLKLSDDLQNHPNFYYGEIVRQDKNTQGVTSFIELEKPVNLKVISKDQLSAPLYQGVIIQGELSPIVNISSGFDAVHYYASQGITAQLQESHIVTVLSIRHTFKQFLYNLNQNIQARVNRLFIEPQASLLNGLILGQKQAMPAELIGNFARSGTSHIIALSGFNVAVVVWVVYTLLLRFGRMKAYFLAQLFIWWFVLLVGSSASIVRAAIMASVVLFAKALGRPVPIVNLILATLVVMSLQNPYALRYDVGLQLSFAALLGIVLFEKGIEHFLEHVMLLKKVPKTILEVIATTLSAQVFTLPIIAFDFGIVSLISPLANLFTVPVVVLPMFFGSLAIAFDAVSPILGQLFIYPTHYLLTYLITCVNFFGNLRWSALPIHFAQAWLVVAYYSIVLTGYGTARFKNKN